MEHASANRLASAQLTESARRTVEHFATELEPRIPPSSSAPPTTECSTQLGLPSRSEVGPPRPAAELGRRSARSFVAPGEFDQRRSAFARRAKDARDTL